MSAPPMTAPTPTSEPAQPTPQQQPPTPAQVAPNVTVISDKPATIVTTTETAGANPATAGSSLDYQTPGTDTTTKPSRWARAWKGGLGDFVTALLILFVPPVAVFLERGCSFQLFLNIFLWLLTIFAGILHALYICVYDNPAFLKKKADRQWARYNKRQEKKEMKKDARKQRKALDAGSVS